MTNSRPVDSLAGLTLTDGYEVVKRINPQAQATGGFFFRTVSSRKKE
ncbi:myosin heavy chain [Candidatus Scalindua japonica]|uniref:Myosin heavy chain n=1 Tax=Candidatus Scalindua japonica TaxID=1284222 RepID=A0A286U2Z1_9BACT|nr:hypothetical protein [Candidatus Scalindua japonica]GAX62499.1 myosin heavy chain [Candidatus Scalindua japonica]